MDPRRKYLHVFFDLDHTLWDFESNSKIALRRVFDTHQLERQTKTSFEGFHQKYSVHNHYYWNQYTLGFIKQEDLRWVRMNHTLEELGVSNQVLAKTLSKDYLDILPESARLFPYTVELLTYLTRKGYQLHILSNGFEEVQSKKLLFAGIHSYFREIITSEASGSVKPDKEIFDYALGKTGATRQESIMVGDNPVADLQGALNAEMHSIYVDHLDQPSAVPFTYSVRHLKEIESLL